MKNSLFKVLFLTILCLGTAPAEKMDINEHDKDYDQKNPPAYQKNLPQLYVCGDSISVGYTPYLKTELKGAISVVHRKDLRKLFPHIAPKLRYSGMAHSLIALTKAVLESDDYHPQYLLLNCGLHDIVRGGANLKKYEVNLTTIIKMAEKHKVQLIWITTSPKATGHGQNKKIIQFNAKARSLMKKHQVPVIDLHKETLSLFKKHGDAQIIKKDRVHFTPLGYKQQAAYIATDLRKVLKK